MSFTQNSTLYIDPVFVNHAIIMLLKKVQFNFTFTLYLSRGGKWHGLPKSEIEFSHLH